MKTSIYVFCLVFAALLAVSMAREEAELSDMIDELAADKRFGQKTSSIFSSKQHDRGEGAHDRGVSNHEESYTED
jgi:hypothetical protein